MFYLLDNNHTSYLYFILVRSHAPFSDVSLSRDTLFVYGYVLIFSINLEVIGMVICFHAGTRANVKRVRRFDGIKHLIYLYVFFPTYVAHIKRIKY